MMVGRRIEAQPSFSWGALVFWLIAAAMVGISAWQASMHWFLAAILPMTLGAAVFSLRDMPFAATFTEEAMAVESPPLEVRYDEIQGLVGVGRPRLPESPGPRRFEIRVGHPGGVVVIPRGVDVPSDKIYRFLSDRVPSRGSREVHEALAEYLEKNEAMFGPERVWSYRGASHLVGRGGGRRRMRRCSLAVTLAAGVWIVAGVSMRIESNRPGAAWFGAGVLLMTFTLPFLLLSLASIADRTASVVKRWRKSSLVISPVGLALAQGDITGDITWDKVQKVRLLDRSRAFRLSHAGGYPGIELKIPGVSIVIADIYDRPLHVIFDRICEYWNE